MTEVSFDPSQHLSPLDTINGMSVRPGFFTITGAIALPGGVSFTIASCGATSCELLLFRPKEITPYVTIPFPENYRIGHVYSMIVFDLNVEEFEYAYSLDGPYDPHKGLLFDKQHVLLDPYAKAVTGQSHWGIQNDASGYHSRVVRNNFDWKTSSQPNIPMSDLIIYELHVRGFSKQAPDVLEPGTFAGLAEKIPYLKKLGINAVELMPIFEFDEMANARKIHDQVLMDYWGYNTVAFFAPNTSYSSLHENNQEGLELKKMIKSFHDNGIEVILDVVFNHTAEGNEDGPFISFKGFDNNIYYLLTPQGDYYNFSGCGNAMNCNHPVVMDFILDCLRYWVTTYRVDGFRFDLASILGRNEDGSPMERPPLLHMLANDPILSNTKLIAEAWDAGGLYQVGSFPAFQRWSEWNGRYRDDMRQFLKGDLWMANAVAQRLIGSPDIYDPSFRGTDASVNFLNCHDGFTLYDLYAYNEKHNSANGWNNTDGNDNNYSWNCGAEGETNDPQVLSLRMRLIKNAFAALMCSRGTPMFLAGDEMGNSQSGNNNSYCQDNEISWLNWKNLKTHQDIYDFARYMIHFRKNHPAIRKNLYTSATGLPFVSVRGADGNYLDFGKENRVVAVLYAGQLSSHKEDLVYFVINAHWDPVTVELPGLPNHMCWKLAVQTLEEGVHFCGEREMVSISKSLYLHGRSVAVLIGGY